MVSHDNHRWDTYHWSAASISINILRSRLSSHKQLSYTWEALARTHFWLDCYNFFEERLTEHNFRELYNNTTKWNMSVLLCGPKAKYIIISTSSAEQSHRISFTKKIRNQSYYSISVSLRQAGCYKTFYFILYIKYNY